MARKSNAVDREFAKIATVTAEADRRAWAATRPKTIVELASEYERAVQDCRTYEDSIAALEEQAASNRASLEEARGRRTAAWQAIEQFGGAA